LILIPLANAVGRRPVALICCLIILGANIWSAMADSYSSFLGARVLSGLGSAANETLMAVVATDIFFLQRRATAVGVFL
jgi:predicted MFS family arabinose efflux permease